MALYINFNNITYFDSFGVARIPEEVEKLENNNSIITDIYRIQANNSIMCGYFCIGFINFMFKGKSLLDYTNAFSPDEHKKNDKIILKDFQ